MLGVAAEQPLRHEVAEVQQVLLGTLEVAPEVGGVLLQRRVGLGQAAPDAHHTSASQLLGVGRLLCGTRDRGERTDLLGHPDRIGTRRDLVGAGPLQRDHPDLPTPGLEHVGEHVDHRQSGRSSILGRVEGRLQAGRQVVVGRLVEHDHDLVLGDARRRGTALHPGTSRQAGRGVHRRHHHPTDLGVARVAEVVLVQLSGLVGLGVGDRQHRRRAAGGGGRSLVGAHRVAPGRRQRGHEPDGDEHHRQRPEAGDQRRARRRGGGARGHDGSVGSAVVVAGRSVVSAVGPDRSITARSPPGRTR